jgi:riboflavin synthase
MFTGIITHQAQVYSLEKYPNLDLLLSLKINSSSLQNQKLTIGCSIACNGICLTLIKIIATHEKYTILFFQASAETVAKTTINNWKLQQIINLEFSLKLGDELGGHLLFGHIDTTTELFSIEKKNESWLFVFKNNDLAHFIAKKGSVAINGVSLTVNEANNSSFSVNIIPHTFFHTNFQFLQVKDKINLEVDCFARYIANYLQHKNLSTYEKNS